VRKEQGLPHVNLSSLHLYLSARKLENTVQWDAGAMIRNAIKGAAKWGATTEDLWPYNPSNFRLTPGTDALEEAKKYRAVSYRRVPRNINCIHSALMERNLVVFGIMLYESFHDDKVVSTGMIKMPKSTEAPIGGHAVVGVGYDRISRTIICPNSWGTSWGDEGYFYLPEAYVLNSDLSDDFWIIRLATPKERN
jgi:C1A family cysteine protease